MLLCWFSNYWYHEFRFGIFYLCEFYLSICKLQRWDKALRSAGWEQLLQFTLEWIFLSWVQGDLNSSTIIHHSHLSSSPTELCEASIDMWAWWIFSTVGRICRFSVCTLEGKMTLLTTCRFSVSFVIVALCTICLIWNCWPDLLLGTVGCVTLQANNQVRWSIQVAL